MDFEKKKNEAEENWNNFLMDIDQGAYFGEESSTQPNLTENCGDGTEIIKPGSQFINYDILSVDVFDIELKDENNQASKTEENLSDSGILNQFIPKFCTEEYDKALEHNNKHMPFTEEENDSQSNASNTNSVDLIRSQLLEYENSLKSVIVSSCLDLNQIETVKSLVLATSQNIIDVLNGLNKIQTEDLSKFFLPSKDLLQKNENQKDLVGAKNRVGVQKVKGNGVLNKAESGKDRIEEILKRHSESLGYDFNLIQSQARDINKIRMNSKDYANFAVGLMMHLFRKEEMSGRNVDGRLDRNKSQNIAKQALDEKRVGLINDLVQELTESSEPSKVWRYCRMKMNRKIIDSCKK